MTQESAIRIARTLFATLMVSTLAFGSVAAERRVRPMNLYLSTGVGSEGGCTPNELTTRATGQSDCGAIAPNGGMSTWATSGADEGFPFTAAADQEADVTIVVSNGGLGVGTYDVVIDVELDSDDEPITAQHEVALDMANGDATIEFTIPIPQETFIEGGRVTVTYTGLGIQSFFINGTGGSYIRIVPVEAG